MQMNKWCARRGSTWCGRIIPTGPAGHVATADKNLAEVNAAYDVVRIHLDKAAAAQAQARREAEARRELEARRAAAMQADAEKRKAEAAQRAAARVANAPADRSRMEIAMAAARAQKAAAARTRTEAAKEAEVVRNDIPRLTIEQALRTENARASFLRGRLANLMSGKKLSSRA